jgi:hypothetical protein
MKKLILASAIALFGTVNAQTFGVKAGLNVSNLTNQNDGATDSKTGFYGGAFLNAPIGANFSIQPEVLYNGKGAKGNGLTLSMDYISIPVMFQYNATPAFYLEAGPELSFLISSKLKASGGSVDVKEAFNGFDIGIGLGAGYNFTQNIGANLRYVAGISDVAKDNAGSAVRNGAFQVGLYYKFSK